MFKYIHLFLLGLVGIIVAVTVFFPSDSFSNQNSKAQELKDFCDDHRQKDQTREQCYYQQFKIVGKEEGDKNAFEILKALQKIDTQTLGCHLIAHGIGSGAYDRDPQNWQSLINNIDPNCSYGAPHGVIENYLASSPDRQLTIEFIPQICGSNPRADCNHIIGHLTLVETKGDVGKALSLCSVFKDDRQRMFCLTGVFMEYQTALNLIEHDYAPRAWLNWPARVPDLEKMCRAQTGENAVACWKEIVHAALVKFKNDPQKIFDFCNTSQSPEGATECKYHAIGIISAEKKFDLENLKFMCTTPQKEENFANECYARLASSLLATIPEATEKAGKFCRGLDEKYQRDCLYQVGLRRTGPIDND